MSLENIVIAVSLLLGIVLLILIIYLISRVNDLEARAFSNQNTGASEKKTEAESQKVFAGLSGRELWDQWVGMANGGDDQYGIRGDRDRFLALLEMHVRALIQTGVDHGDSGKNEPPSNPLKIKMLRGQFESYIPSSQAERLYALGRDLGASEDTQQRASIVAAITETVDAISMGIDAGSSFVESALRDISAPAEPEPAETDQDLLPSESQSA
jgi:hypothetical protein